MVGRVGYKDRSRRLIAIGCLLLLAGIALGLLAPLEMYCFYLFSRGGRFYYEGFGFGSFMFGNIAAQIVGYDLIAAVFIVLGYGHVRLRRWARPLSLAILRAWQVIGAPLIVLVAFIWFATKDLTLPVALTGSLLLLSSYFVIPILLIRFYRGENVRQTFAARESVPSWIEATPTSILVLSLLYGFFAVMLHLLILFNGIYPGMGRFVYGFQGIALITVSMAALFLLTWGTLRRRIWAWWGGVVLWGLFTFSTIFTFLRTDYTTLLAGLSFPPRELDILDGIPLQGWHLALLIGLPLAVTWGIILASKRDFVTTRPSFSCLLGKAGRVFAAHRSTRVSVAHDKHCAHPDLLEEQE